MTRSLLGGAAVAVSVGLVKITFARIEDGKQLAGSCSTKILDSTPQDAMSYIGRACDRDAVLETIAEQSGKSVDELLTELNAANPAPAVESAPAE